MRHVAPVRLILETILTAERRFKVRDHAATMAVTGHCQYAAMNRAAPYPFGVDGRSHGSHYLGTPRNTGTMGCVFSAAVLGLARLAPCAAARRTPFTL
jgi:hypothetical protein